MHTSTKKWLFLKCSSLILIPLMIWFIINLVSIYDSDYKDLVNFLSSSFRFEYFETFEFEFFKINF